MDAARRPGRSRHDRPGFNAVVLAGERKRNSALPGKFHVPIKALIPVCGRPMLQRVLDSLLASRFVMQVFLCSPEMSEFAEMPGLSQAISSGRISWVRNEQTPSRSALKALEQAGGGAPVLLTTADHALLTAEMVDFFCSAALNAPEDLLVGLARLDIIRKAFPDVRRTFYRFRGGCYSSCNLFGFMSRKAFRAAGFWQEIEQERKHPARIISRFGWTWAARYLAGRLGLEQAFIRASAVLGCNAGPVIMPFPEAAIDVDTLEDWQLAEKIIEARCQKQHPSGGRQCSGCSAL